MNIDVYILTSSDVYRAERAVRSVWESDRGKYDINVVVMVNSTKSNHYKLVKDAVGKFATVVKSESNGKPGKGKNAVLDHARACSQADYIFCMDGDDFLYPWAWHALDPLITDVALRPDVIGLMSQDVLDQMEPINLNSWDNHQPNLSVTNPRDMIVGKDFDLWNTWSIDRLILLNTSVLEILPRFPEDMEIYEDWVMTAMLTKMWEKGEVYYKRINNSCIYCYDSQNSSESACSLFYKDPELAQFNMDKFWRYIKGLAPVRYSEVPFTTLPFMVDRDAKEIFIRDLHQSPVVQDSQSPPKVSSSF